MPRKRNAEMQKRINALEVVDDISMPPPFSCETIKTLIADEDAIVRISNCVSGLFPLEFKISKGQHITNNTLVDAIICGKKVKHHFENLCLSPNQKK